MQQRLKLFISLLIPILILLVPKTWMPIDHLSIIEHRFMAIFFLAMFLWVLEPIPIYATSILIVVLQLVMVSDHSLVFFMKSAQEPAFGTVLSYKNIMSAFASPIVMLFLGGFYLAAAATKYRLDINLARVLLKPFGTHPKRVMLGLMLSTAIFSMFMSNTATTAMMLALLSPVLAALKPNDQGKLGFVIAIPFAANIGGIGTPIGTPPNAVAMKYLTGENAVSFGSWMMFALPLVTLLLLFAWFLLSRLYPSDSQRIQLDIKSKFLISWQAITVYSTFALTILLWLLDFLHGMNSYIVAMIPVAVFSITGIVNSEDMKRLGWDVLWLIAGGIALGQGLEQTGLARHFIDSIPFDTFSPYTVVVLATGITILMATFMSNTATANLLLPIIAALGAALSGLAPLGGVKMIVIASTLAASLAMSLAVSTPPNAMAHATGILKSKHMLLPGILIGLVGLAGVYVLMIVLKWVNFV
jgi:solute carrier family 13 (sodium-dependent dicarboxylate transporter), member 2/3/5